MASEKELKQGEELRKFSSIIIVAKDCPGGDDPDVPGSQLGEPKCYAKAVGLHFACPYARDFPVLLDGTNHHPYFNGVVCSYPNK